MAICNTKGYIKPTAYQGIYNAVHRNVEPELFPCLRKYGIAFYEYNPCASRLLSGILICENISNRLVCV